MNPSIHLNISHAGLYTKSRNRKIKDVTQCFSEQNKVNIRFLPTSKEDKTTNIGCATVFLEILENTGLINITRKNTKIGGE